VAHERLAAMSQQLRTRLDTDCAAVLRSALDDSAHTPETVDAIVGLAASGNGDQVRVATALAPLLGPADADALVAIAAQDSVLAFPALHALLAQKARGAALGEWRGAAVAAGGAAAELLRPAHAKHAGAREQLSSDLAIALRAAAHVASCAP
jgi:hypothetical protein